MAGANSNIQLTSLDFNTLKGSFKNFLRSQDTFKDYNFEGSGMAVLLDVLAYNTQYNAYYLNQVANEMFLDSAVQRASVVSHAKLLNYTPKSAICPTATVNIIIDNVTQSSLTLPAYTTFLCSTINNVNYTFVNTNAYTVNVVNGTATFNNVEIKQGILSNYNFTVNSTTNPTYTFEIPDDAIDTTSMFVSVQDSLANSSYDIYSLADSYLSLTGDSKVYFLQESLRNSYEIYFGDGLLGKKLTDGNIVSVAYLSTEGSSAAGANSFTMMDSVAGYTPTSVNSVIAASEGGAKESIDSIKFQAPKSFSAQKRAVSKNDYISAIQQNKLGIAFDAISVWGGEENDPPVYGQIFVSLKPTGSYKITDTQKTQIINEVIKPISVLTITPTIIDPDYTYLKLTVNVIYDPNQTVLTASQIQAGVKIAIQNFADTTLNTFNSTFNPYELLSAIQSFDKSIITSEYDVRMEKKFFPNLISATTYNLAYGTTLNKSMFLSGVASLPAMSYLNQSNLAETITGVYLEEVPSVTNGVESISILNPGFNYTSAPTVTILGDGEGATAHAVIINGSISSVVVDSAGSGYTSALALITNASEDTTGQAGALTVNLEGRYGTIRSYYFDTNTNVKNILNSNAGVIDYQNGTITLNNFNPSAIDNTIGELAISVKPTTSIISSTYNKIITINPYDTNSIIVNVTAKSSW